MHPWRLLWTGRARLYYNASDEAPYVWSIDDGYVENAYKVTGVTIQGGLAYRTASRTELDVAQPKVWIETIPGVVCSIYLNEEDRSARITWK